LKEKYRLGISKALNNCFLYIYNYIVYITGFVVTKVPIPKTRRKKSRWNLPAKITQTVLKLKNT